MQDNLIKLHESRLWKTYSKKNPSTERSNWIEKVYVNAVQLLKEVPKTFPNYTLHDEIHVLNVMEAMAGLLGDQISNLTLGECELLILSAALHDIGMVYKDNDITEETQNQRAFQAFLRDKYPDRYGASFDELGEDGKKFSTIQQDYLRFRHPFRLPKVLNDAVWGFNTKPLETVPKSVIIDVCQSHGEGRVFLESKHLNYLGSPRNVDPRFCALLLRLGDILDFDGSRAPEILSGFAEGIKQSEEAYAKHGASGGFSYPTSPSDLPLGYYAECNDPEVNFKLRSYLDWVDQELLLANTIKTCCKNDWQRYFSFPREVSREQITCVNFDSKPFSITMNQEHILDLLKGRSLYSDSFVFIRELLQNAIDATLLRGKMDPAFDIESERASIYFWYGFNAEGVPLLRIDDHGTGMTRGMLYRYFLKVGCSYYQSNEIKQDLLKHHCLDDYHSISRFGIGFLSCFFCGTAAVISTLYYDEQKCKDENDYNGYEENGFGLRVIIPGLTGHYALHNQALHDQLEDSLPFPSSEDNTLLNGLEYCGYRQEPGTSIVVKLNPDMIGALDPALYLETNLCAPRMPVYFNGKRIGRTYQELMTAAHSLPRTKIYEMSEDEKKEFNKAFPESIGNYPKLSVTMTVLDPTNEPKIEDLSIISIQQTLLYTPQKFQYKDQYYILEFTRIDELLEDSLQIHGSVRPLRTYPSLISWESLNREFSAKTIERLEKAFASCEACPKSPEEISDAWNPFSGKLGFHDAWISYLDYCVKVSESFEFIAFHSTPMLSRLCGTKGIVGSTISFQGIRLDNRRYSFGSMNSNPPMLTYLEGIQRPGVTLSRSDITSLPVEVGLLISVLNKGQPIPSNLYFQDGKNARSLSSWRVLRHSKAARFVIHELSGLRDHLQLRLQNSFKKSRIGKIIYNPHHLIENPALTNYVLAELQDYMEIHICYEEGGVLHFTEKTEIPDKTIYDIFPPMPFCLAASDESRNYLCTADGFYRRGITADHPYAKWLIKNAIVLQNKYPIQFMQIVDCLLKNDAEAIISQANKLRELIIQQKAFSKITLEIPIELTEEDFWQSSDE